MKTAIAVVCAATLTACATAQLSEETARAELIATSQALLDAVTSGDQDVFRRTLDPDGLFTDEEGNVRRGAELIPEIRGLPPGYVGSLRVVDPQVRFDGDTAIVTYEVAETLDLYNQRLETRFHTTDVYRRVAGEWRLIGAHTSVLPSELDPVAVDVRVFADYAGTYRLSEEVTARIWSEDGKLYMQRAERDREELLAIGNDRFVRSGATRGERFFRRDADGRVIELVDRRDNNDLVWRRD